MIPSLLNPSGAKQLNKEWFFYEEKDNGEMKRKTEHDVRGRKWRWLFYGVYFFPVGYVAEERIKSLSKTANNLATKKEKKRNTFLCKLVGLFRETAHRIRHRDETRSMHVEYAPTFNN